MEGRAEDCVERYRESAQKSVSRLNQVETPCSDDHDLKKDDFEVVGEFSFVCAEVVLKCLCFARIGRLDILWTVYTLARIS